MKAHFMRSPVHLVYPSKIDLRKQINFCGEVECAKISPVLSSALIFVYINSTFTKSARFLRLL